eukprot:TRINITY_DN77782_c0_g1_i1.p1 TRINITY_DN77782_c0_g1~~TRINITY_DN77782_c0_g1_i1.p1  ORF type:complete len:257 (-),score=43.34 TRINITY_DN77782_c0_g1_i1:172-882(-)
MPKLYLLLVVLVCGVTAEINININNAVSGQGSNKCTATPQCEKCEKCPEEPEEEDPEVVPELPFEASEPTDPNTVGDFARSDWWAQQYRDMVPCSRISSCDCGIVKDLTVRITPITDNRRYADKNHPQHNPDKCFSVYSKWQWAVAIKDTACLVICDADSSWSLDNTGPIKAKAVQLARDEGWTGGAIGDHFVTASNWEVQPWNGCCGCYPHPTLQPDDCVNTGRDSNGATWALYD